MGCHPLPHSVGGGLGAVGAAGLGENIADMRRYRVEADRQRQRDVGVAAAYGNQAQYLGLARGQVVGRTRAGQFFETAGGALYLRYSPKGRTSGVYEYTTGAGIVTTFKYPQGEAAPGDVVDGEFTVRCAALTRGDVA